MNTRNLGLLGPTVLVLLVASTATVTTAYYQVHGPALHALLILSLVASVLGLRGPRGHGIGTTPWLLAVVFLIYALVAVASAWQVDFNAEALDRLENYVYYLGAAFLIPFLVRHPSPPGWFWYAVAAAAALSGLYACWEYLQFGPEHRAAGSKGKAIPFGDIAVLSSVLSLLGACLYAQTRPYRAAAFALAALLGGYASLASDTRGAWIFLPAGLGAVIVFLIKSYPAYRRAFVMAGLAASLAGVAMALQMDQIRGRFDEGVSQIRDYGQGQVVTAGNAMGERLEMWRAAMAAFREQPLLGIGVGQINGYFVAAARRGDLSPVIAEFDQGSGHTHAHSDYVDALATRGLIGLVSLLLLYLVPLGIFTGAAFKAEQPEARAIAYAGIVVILGYMHFSLTDSVLLMRITAGYFVLLIAWLAALVLASGRQPPVPPGPPTSRQTVPGHA